MQTIETQIRKPRPSRKGVAWSIRDGKKKCARCDVVKPAEEFYPKKSGGVESYCIDCKRIGQTQQPPCSLESMARRFWLKVDKRGPTDCWPWLGATINKEGRGTMFVGGPKVNELAHRVSLRIHGVDVPDAKTGFVVDHMCKSPSCVNPAHLRIVTATQNATDFAPTGFTFKNKAKVECHKGHPFSLENTAYVLVGGKTRHGHPRGKLTKTRVCLTCYPRAWRYSFYRREAPPGARVAKYGEWIGPQWVDETPAPSRV